MPEFTEDLLDAHDRWLVDFMQTMMTTIDTVHDFISTCAYAREIRDKEDE